MHASSAVACLVTSANRDSCDLHKAQLLYCADYTTHNLIAYTTRRTDMAYATGSIASIAAPQLGRCKRTLRCRRSVMNTPVAKAIAQEQTPQQAGTKEAENQLEALKAISLVVADTGEIDSIRNYRPVDCTTNPSLVLKAVQNPQYHHYLETAMAEEDDYRDSANSDR